MLRIVAFVRSGVHPGLTEGLSQEGERQIRDLASEIVGVFREAGVLRPCIIYTLANGTLYLGREEAAFMLASAFAIPSGDVHSLDTTGADQLTAELEAMYSLLGKCDGLIVVTSSEHTMALMQRMARDDGMVLPIPELPPGRAHLFYPGKFRHSFLFPKRGF